MPMKSYKRFLTSTLGMLAAGIAVLLVMVGSSLWLVSVNSSYSQETAQLRRIRAAVVDLLAIVQDAETGQRGFLLTDDPDYLPPYERAVGEMAAGRERLRQNIAGYPEYQGDLPELKRMLDGKMNEVTRTVALAREGNLPGAIEMLRTDRGREYMDSIRTILSKYQTMTDDRLRVIVANQLSVANTLKWVTVGGAIAIVIVLAGALYIISRYMLALSRAREEVVALNIGLEERVNERTQDLIRANQEIQRFAYIVTHDLRAPLVNIMGFLSEFDAALGPINNYVLADGRALSQEEIRDARTAVEEDLPEAIRFIRSSTRKMDQLINAILKISRDGRRKIVSEQIDLEALVNAAAASVGHQIAASGGEMKVALAARRVVSDRISLDQIFGNLFDNAVKYQMPGRPLRLTVTSRLQGRGVVRIDVSDNGRGIAKQDFERVFELFRRAGEQDQPGEGIGLAHVRSLIRNLGGDITVESEPGKGSTFILTLPIDLTRIVRSSEL